MKYLVGNWKMHGSRALAESLVAASQPSKHRVVLCPPFTLLHEIRSEGISLGAQDCSPEAKGAFTGDISAAMLKEAGCEWVILGHSERRQHHAETDALINQKLNTALAAGLKVILCIGEKEGEDAEAIVKKQLSFLTKHEAQGTNNILIAYEPVWAIGSGKTPTLEQIETVHRFIKTQVKQASVLYGGSVKPGNIQEILGLPSVDGVLVGGASIDPSAWAEIVQS